MCFQLILHHSLNFKFESTFSYILLVKLKLTLLNFLYIIDFTILFNFLDY